MKTLGMKNRNPLNIRYDPRNKWLGSKKGEKGFCYFSSCPLGYRAALLLLRNYVRKGYKSISAIIHRWAPDSENDTKSYLDYVCKNFGAKGVVVSPDYEIETDLDLVNLVRPMSILESRIDPVDVCDLMSILNQYNIHI